MYQADYFIEVIIIHILFEVLATILMIINVLYVIRVFFILKNSKNSDNLKKKNLNIVGDLYIALLILFVVGYVCISLNNNGENSIQLNIMAQIMFWGAVFVFISVYVFRTLLKITKDQYIGELSDLQISLDTYIKSIPGGVHHCVVEPELRVYYVSKGFTDITGYTMEEIDELYNGKYTDFVYEADRSTFVAAIERLLRTMSETVVSYRIVSKRGDIIWVSDSMNIVKDSKGNRHIFAVVLDITDEKSSAETDALTGILNKGAFNFNVRECMKLHADEHIALFMIDLNYFKEVNDKYGHHSGDTILIKTVEYLKAAFVDEDAIIGRVGGDEFMVLVKSVISEDAVMALKKKVQDNFRLRIDDIPDFPPVSGSVGCIFAKCSDDFETVFRRADNAMYDEKDRAHALRK